MITYEKYCNDLKRFNQPITMTEDEFIVKYAPPKEEIPRQFIAPTLKNYKDTQTKLVVKPDRPSSTQCYKTIQGRKYRAKLQAKGLTTRGTIPIVRELRGTTATRANKAAYMKSYRERIRNEKQAENNDSSNN